MNIPSPRQAIEIVAFSCFAICVLVGMVIATGLLALIWAGEAICDRFVKAGRRRT